MANALSLQAATDPLRAATDSPQTATDPLLTATDPLQTAAIPPVALTVAVVVLFSLLVAVVIVTVGYSLRAARRRRRRTPIRSELRSELLDRLYGRDEPGWDAWVGALSATERDELESLLDVYLRELDGRDARRLAGLGVALGIDERARRDIADGDYWDRIHALVWLALLRDAPDRSLLEARCRETPRERAAATRVLYAAATPDLATTGVDLLLGADPQPFSVFGIDTLYRVGETDPAPLFERAAADFETWAPALQQQVLLVTRHLNTVVGGADLSWVVGALSAPESRVRGAAWRALDAYGWNRGLRSAIGDDPIADEPAPAVRASAYRTFGAWGDGGAVTALRAAAGSEPDDRARVALARALYPHRDHDGPVGWRRDASDPAPGQRDGIDAVLDRRDATDAALDAPVAAAGDTPDSVDNDTTVDPFDVAWRWTSEHARFDRIARDVSGTRDRRETPR